MRQIAMDKFQKFSLDKLSQVLDATQSLSWVSKFVLGRAQT